MVEDNRENSRTTPEISVPVGDQLGAVREIAETRTQNNLGGLIPLLIMMIILTRNNNWNNWNNGCGGLGFNNFL